MSIAVIKTGGKQYKVREKEELLVERLKTPKNQSQDAGLVVFSDLLSDKKVTARLLSEKKGKKVRILKFRPRKRYRRKTGHRQIYSKIRIEKIE